MSTQSIGERVLEALRRAGITAKPYKEPLLPKCSACFSDSRLDIEVPLSARFQAKRVLEQELGDGFVVRCHTHPNAYPQNVVYVFPADKAWPDKVFTVSNVKGRTR